ncbi:hypothetical protein BDW69DRAFT_165221 [Aspergillus filifer]
MELARPWCSSCSAEHARHGSVILNMLVRACWACSVRNIFPPSVVVSRWFSA